MIGLRRLFVRIRIRIGSRISRMVRAATVGAGLWAFLYRGGNFGTATAVAEMHPTGRVPTDEGNEGQATCQFGCVIHGESITRSR